jgi:hypothetical protein
MFVDFVGGSTSPARSPFYEREPFNSGHVGAGPTAVHVQGRKLVRDAVPGRALKRAEVRVAVYLELV